MANLSELILRVTCQKGRVVLVTMLIALFMVVKLNDFLSLCMTCQSYELFNVNIAAL